MTIKITGLDVIVDDDMRDKLSQYKWSVQSRKHGIYFAAKVDCGDGKKKALFLHRFIMGNPAGKLVDHRDGNHFDCRRQNLRVCGIAENSRNTKTMVTNTSGFRGVTRRGKKFEARIHFNGRETSLGRFNTPEEASVIYEAEAKKLFGEFYREACSR